MSLKDLFKNQEISTVLPATSPEEMSRDLESSNFIDASLEEKGKFRPIVDYSEPANFARFGLAEKYYEDSFNHILNTYPYDGSKREKILWNLSSSGLDLYIFENEFPRTTGYISLGNNYGSINGIQSDYASYGEFEYIEIRGGPNTSSAGMIGSSLTEVFNDSNKWNEDKRRVNNLELDLDKGLTVEFWLKRGSYVSGSQSPKQVIFDVSNGVLTGSSIGRFRIQIHPGVSGQEDRFYLTFLSGTSGLGTEVAVGSDLDLLSNSWNHYSLSLKNNGSSIRTEVYKNGNINQIIDSGTICGPVVGPLIGNIGALGNAVSSQTSKGWAKLSGSLDEFRFWKARRNGEQIGRFYFTQVGGGTNTDDANTDLGVYYKFNEGIFDDSETSSQDAVVLDYSGRFSNGNWVGYSLGGRNTGSAMNNEFRDPIIYSSHPLIAEKLAELKDKGYIHDSNNSDALFYTLPTWIQDEDENKDTPLKNLFQVISFYFDDLFLQIKEMPKLHDAKYVSTGSQVSPFVSRVLMSAGLEIPNIFSKAEAMEYFANRNNTAEFEKSFEETKNLIYQNLYNNLTHLYKNKGTYDGYRNIARCFGIDENLVNLGIYSNNERYKLTENVKYSSQLKNFVDFNNHDRFEGTIYQITSSGLSSRSYIDKTGLPLYSGETYECEVVFPLKYKPNDSLYFETGFLTSSIFGIHEVVSSDVNKSWANPDRSNFLVQAVRTELESEDVRFQISSSVFPTLTTDVFPETYNDTNWNLTVRIQKPVSNQNSTTGAWEVHFIGKQYYQDVLQNSFSLSTSVSDSFVTANKRVFAGSHRQNFTGSLLERSDVKITNLRVWMTELDDQTLDRHAKDITIFGGNKAFEPTTINPNLPMNVPQITSLALAWSFDGITGSNSSGQFSVADISSGSSAYKQNSYLSSSTNYFHPGLGDFFTADDEQIISKEYIQIAKFAMPEQVLASGMVNILSEDDEIFTRDTRPIRTLFTIEKSPYHLISEEMIKFIGGLKDFNNLIGEPINRYRQDYKMMEKARNLFFSSIENEVDVEKFLDYWKWIDTSVVKIIEQFIPASALLSKKIMTVIESHILERNKYWTKFPTMEFKTPTPEGAIKGVNELLYDYSSGSAPVVKTQEQNGLWWKQRAERTGILSTGFSSVDSSRQKILDASLTALNRSFSTPVRLTANSQELVGGRISSLFKDNFPRIRNIKNSNSNTASNDNSFVVNPVENFVPLNGAYEPLGNYREAYEIVNTSGRKTNNSWFVKNNGVSYEGTNSLFIDGAVDFLLPNRSVHKHVFVETFSAPGGPEINARGIRDVESEEYSVFNDLNQRNSIVRRVLDTWSKTSNEKFGISSEQVLGEDVPGFHKVHPNPKKIIRNNITSSLKDNLIINHPIPQSDLQYSWVSQSQDPNFQQPFGYSTNFYRPAGTTSSLDPEAVVFLSSSQDGKVFLQLNSQDQQMIWEVNTDDQILSSSGDADANERNLSRIGPWGWSSWKQLRVGEHQVSRKLRKKNIVSIVQGVRDEIRQFFEPPIDWSHHPVEHVFLPKNSTSLVSFQHSWGNNKQGFANPELNSRSGYKNNEIQIYDKLKDLYINTELDTENNPIDRFERVTYTKTIYPRQEVVGLEKVRNRRFYTEPSVRTTATSGSEANYNIAVPDYTAETGIDRGWLERRTFWRDRYEDRTRQGTVADIGQGAWAGATTLNNAFGVKDGFANSVFGFGIETDYTESYSNFQNTRTFEDRNFDSGEINAFRHSTRIFGWYGAAQVLSAGFGAPYAYDLVEVMKYPTASYNYYFSHCPLIANPDLIQIRSGSYFYHPPRYRVHIEAGKNPFFDSYGDFISPIKNKTNNMSRFSEFTISDFIPYYVLEKGGNFRIKNTSFLTDIGSEVSQSSQNTEEEPVETFFKEKVFSLLDNNFQTITQDHRKVDGKIEAIKISVKGIKKLLPYNGFYPSHRSAQMVSLFSQSYSDFFEWEYDGPNPVETNDKDFYTSSYALQAALDHFYNPGIFYNSLKSGIAVDSACFTGSLPNNSIGFFGISPSFRMPFESVIDLRNGCPVSGVVPNSTVGSGKVFGNYPYYATSAGYRIQPFFFWKGDGKNLYPLASNNFFAESVNFFLKNSSMKTVSSIPAYQAKGKFKNGVTYYLDVVVYKTKKYEIWKSAVPYSQPRDFRQDSNSGSLESFDGYGFGPTYISYDSDTVRGSVIAGETYSAIDPSQAPNVPPYLYGTSVARISYVADGNEVSSEDILSKIFSSIEVENYNDALLERIKVHNQYRDPTIRNNSTYLLDPEISASSLPCWIARSVVSSSINLFSRTALKDVEFDSFGIPSTVSDTQRTNNEVWSIQPKWECPNFNFSSSQYHTINRFVSSSTQTFYPPVGLWSAYGQIPDNDEGIFFAVRNSFNKDEYEKDPSIGSLIDVFGFDTTPQRIGEIANSKEISEGIVVIPFVDKEILGRTMPVLGKHFFKITRDVYERQKKNKLAGKPAITPEDGFSVPSVPDTTISNLSQRMKEYVFPPFMDFSTYDDINPFVLYLFEFKHNLSKQDLGDIWQGLMPEISINAEEESIQISHRNEPWEFFEGKDIPSEIRYAIFKVKRKAEKNYYKITADSRDDERFKFDFEVGAKEPEYSFNWPYDFFSLVEMGKVDVSYTIKPQSSPDVPQFSTSTDALRLETQQRNTGIIRKTGITGKKIL